MYIYFIIFLFDIEGDVISILEYSVPLIVMKMILFLSYFHNNLINKYNNANLSKSYTIENSAQAKLFHS